MTAQLTAKMSDVERKNLEMVRAGGESVQCEVGLQELLLLKHQKAVLLYSDSHPTLALCAQLSAERREKKEAKRMAELTAVQVRPAAAAAAL